MPAKSAAQLRWAYWTASGKNPNVPASVGQEFVDKTPRKVKQSMMLHHRAQKGFRARAKDGYK